MNKSFKSFTELHNLKEVDDNFCGKINGFTFVFNFNYLRTPSPLVFKVDFYSDEETKMKILAELSSTKIKSLIIKDTGTGLLFGMNDPLSAKRLFSKFDSKLKQITDCLSKYVTEDLSICPVCGNQIENIQTLTTPDKFNINICEECYNKTIDACNTVVENYNNHKFEIVRPIFGAILAAFICSILFIIVYLFGFISGIVGFVAVHLAAKLYMKFNGKPDYKMIIIVSAISLITMCLTVYSLYYFVANNSEYTTSLDGMENFMNLLADNEAKVAFISDMLMTVVFTLLGIAFSISTLIRKTKLVEKEILKQNNK